jgi:methanogenic corrinoid protein MtbC1
VVQAIKTQIIPKIFIALRAVPPAAPAKISSESEIREIKKFATLAIGYDDDAVSHFVEALMAKGTSVETIFLDWLTPAARYLGELWESDASDFATVTLGMSRLQRVLRQISDTFVEESKPVLSGESALLTTVPGEQHSFGLSMVSEFFRRAGWNLCVGPFESQRDVTSLVHNHWFDVVGFSVSSERNIDGLRSAISEIRRDSRNRNIGVILGGPMLIEHPELVASVGADMMSTDATVAPQQARHLIDQMNAR